jgi:nitrite reductase/ring-hydroxylating ferredoxin subunit
MKRLCSVNDLPESQARGFQLASGPVFAVRKNGSIFVYQNACPHRGVELEWMENRFLDPSGMLIQCSTHGAQFVIETGQCVSGPCLGESLQPVSFEVIDNDIVLTG